jgi:hypothetical protein
MPKISVRVGARGLHLGIYAPVEIRDLPVERTDVAQYLRGQPPSEAGRGATLGTYAARDARCPVGRECLPYPVGDEIPQEAVQTVERPSSLLGHQVFAPLGKQAHRLSTRKHHSFGEEPGTG